MKVQSPSIRKIQALAITIVFTTLYFWNALENKNENGEKYSDKFVTIQSL